MFIQIFVIMWQTNKYNGKIFCFGTVDDREKKYLFRKEKISYVSLFYLRFSFVILDPKNYNVFIICF